MYYIVHIVFVLAGFVAGTFGWASLCIHSFLGPGAGPFWCVGGFAGMGVGWWIAWMLVTNAPKASATIGMVGLALSLVPWLGIAALSVLNLGLGSPDSPLVWTLRVICLAPPPLALVTNIIAVCRHKSIILGTIGLVISVAACAVELLELLVAILFWSNGPLMR